MTTKEQKTAPGEGTPPSPLHNHGGQTQNQGNIANKAQSGNSIAANLVESQPKGTQGGNNNKIHEGHPPTPLPSGTQEGNIHEAQLGSPVPRGTFSMAGAAAAAPALTQHDTNDVSESSSSMPMPTGTQGGQHS